MSEEFSIEQSTNIGNLSWALCQAQKEMHFATKDASNPFFKSKYADLASVWNCCKEPLTKWGLSIMQFPCGNGDSCGLITILSWSWEEGKDPEWIRCKFVMKPKDNSPQAMGSCLTYMRRYALSAVVGVIADDDDGNGAQVSKPSPMSEQFYTGAEVQKEWLIDIFKMNHINKLEDMKSLAAKLSGKQMNHIHTLIKEMKSEEPS